MIVPNPHGFAPHWGNRMTITADMLCVEIFADGADKKTILELAAHPLVKGFTTNPTLMRQAGVTDYEGFAKDVLSAVSDRPISFEVFSDDFDEMYVQACKIATWAPNVFVKIPITNTRGESAVPLIKVSRMIASRSTSRQSSRKPRSKRCPMRCAMRRRAISPSSQAASPTRAAIRCR